MNTQARTARCPVCGRPAAAATKPFCSARCADVDLGRWFGEVYRVAGTGVDADPRGQAADRDTDDEAG